MLTSKVLPEVVPAVVKRAEAEPKSCSLRHLLELIWKHEPEDNCRPAYTLPVLRDALGEVSRSITSSYAITMCANDDVCVITYDSPNWRRGDAATAMALGFFRERSAILPMLIETAINMLNMQYHGRSWQKPTER